MIRFRYRDAQGREARRTFKTERRARSFATRIVGDRPSFGRGYALAPDEYATIHDVEGCDVRDLFGARR